MRVGQFHSGLFYKQSMQRFGTSNPFAAKGYSAGSNASMLTSLGTAQIIRKKAESIPKPFQLNKVAKTSFDPLEKVRMLINENKQTYTEAVAMMQDGYDTYKSKVDDLTKQLEEKGLAEELRTNLEEQLESAKKGLEKYEKEMNRWNKMLNTSFDEQFKELGEIFRDLENKMFKIDLDVIDLKDKEQRNYDSKMNLLDVACEGMETLNELRQAQEAAEEVEETTEDTAEKLEYLREKAAAQQIRQEARQAELNEGEPTVRLELVAKHILDFVVSAQTKMARSTAEAKQIAEEEFHMDVSV